MPHKDLVRKLHPLERKLLPFLREHHDFQSLVRASSLQEVEVMRALQWLETKQLIQTERESLELVSLDENGKIYVKKGLPERKILNALIEKEYSLEDLKHKTKLSSQEISVSIGTLRMKQAIVTEKNKTLIIKITDHGKHLQNKAFLEEQFLETLAKGPKQIGTLSEEEQYAYQHLQKRKQIVKKEVVKEIVANLTPLGKELAKENLSVDMVDKITPELLRSKAWKGKEFRAFDITSPVPKIDGGRTHFTSKALDYGRRVWLDMGFKEMTGPIVQTSFWNFDSLFVPQDHPAREMQDTFFVNIKGNIDDKKLLKKVKAMHETGDEESSGWQYSFSEEESKKVVLRTHTTALSSQTIAKLKKEDLPVKYFAIGKCFRNETVDWSHGFEFNQTEGIVIDPNANFRHLLGYLKQFFAKMGYPKARFRPAYFPYTEPSVEIDVYIEEKQKWIELGGAGMFRPEVVKPLLGFECPVLAWGPGIDRLIMLAYNLSDLRDLHKNDLKQLQEIQEWKY